jgi:hypothetical protein
MQWSNSYNSILKLNPWAFKRLNEVTVKTFDKTNKVYAWYGLRVMAI